MFKAKAIEEEGISRIEVEVSSTYNRAFIPLDGRAKWFRDELNQLWVKFITVSNADQELVQHVIPASRVVEVLYPKG
jgi:hypothetical protein